MNNFRSLNDILNILHEKQLNQAMPFVIEAIEIIVQELNAIKKKEENRSKKYRE